MRIKEEAEAGKVGALFYMGLASIDVEEKKRWLKLAIEKGSKEAAAYYAFNLDERWKTEPFTPELHAELLQPIIEAAEAGDPRSATWLMEMARGQKRHCPWMQQNCPQSPLIRLEDAFKWSEIAALGGNMGAAEFICGRLMNSSNRGGFIQNDEKAYFWCQIAAPQSCAVSAKIDLATLYHQKRVPSYAPPLGDYWQQRSEEASEYRTYPYKVGPCF